VRQRSILYVDDYQDACDLMVTFLTGFSVSTATSAAEALALCRHRLFDLYLLDYCLPDLSGIDLCREIRTFDPNAPIVFYTAADQDNYDDLLAAGAQAYFLKPGSLSQLLQTMEGLIGKSESRCLEARVAEIAAMQDGISARLQRAAAHVRRADELEMKRQARSAFIGAGGTRADFERLWPDVRKTACPDFAV